MNCQQNSKHEGGNNHPDMLQAPTSEMTDLFRPKHER